MHPYCRACRARSGCRSLPLGQSALRPLGSKCPPTCAKPSVVFRVSCDYLYHFGYNSQQLSTIMREWTYPRDYCSLAASPDLCVLPHLKLPRISSKSPTILYRQRKTPASWFQGCSRGRCGKPWHESSRTVEMWTNFVQKNSNTTLSATCTNF